jgi:hypothetical protein
MAGAGRNDPFKMLPDHARQKTPVSEYLLGYLEKPLKGVVAFRAEFEAMFDRFEVLDALTIYSRGTDEKRVWSPPGRFLWKAESYDGGPLAQLQAEATLQGDNWAPTRAGLFGGSTARFIDLAGKYRAEYVNKVGW